MVNLLKQLNLLQNQYNKINKDSHKAKRLSSIIEELHQLYIEKTRVINQIKQIYDATNKNFNPNTQLRSIMKNIGKHFSKVLSQNEIEDFSDRIFDLVTREGTLQNKIKGFKSDYKNI